MSSIKNEMIHITKNELKEKLIHINKENTTIVELDGRNIQDKFSYIDEMREKFKLQDSHRYRDMSIEGVETINWDAFDDRMTELSGFPDDMGFVLIIYHFYEFLKDDLENKQRILRIFNNTLYFWEEEVLTVAVEWKTKAFNIYLVD
ncbi:MULTISPECIES: barstar family protein [unclassified Granulicatella]|uniref:barstar family protein n=1 Tax=unclassified Granulicatella TaxID=2630493 RepID=UPI00107387D3|nr:MULTISPECIES: barstar family protein [unclassified Granulicatella]MBF0779508.1 barstar family protein [Granulicatella sp. 19428wC4_WM01]TFU96474.1 hypothetical protein E4T68_00225 [Granulicatella sp. WM01]